MDLLSPLLAITPQRASIIHNRKRLVAERDRVKLAYRPPKPRVG
jgi:hypothetical protein